MDLREKILGVMAGPHPAAVATLDGTRPVVRYMLLRGFPDMTLVGGTLKSPRKVAQLEKSPEVSIAVWSGREFTDPYVEIRARGTIREDMATKKKYWDPMFLPYFRSVDNPDFVILIFTPLEIAYYIPSTMSFEVWKPS